jgi:protease-4
MNDLPSPPPEQPANEPLPPLVLPVRPPRAARRSPEPPPPPSRPSGGLGTLFKVMLGLLLLGSLGLNLIFLVSSFFTFDGAGSEPGPPVTERHYSGPASAGDKVAVIKVDGMIMEGMLGYAHKQIERAARDKNVKAVVLRVESPGGTITGSDDLLRRLVDLRKGGTETGRYGPHEAKPMVVSMGNVAASGGYYISMAADAGVVAERTTITGSIGVYASFIDASELGQKYGVKMELVKAGDVKGGGMLLQKMSPQERQPWQDMVDSAYKQFLGVVEEGRPQLKDKLTAVIYEREAPLRDDKGNVISKDGKVEHFTYKRQRADGGIFTADEAKKHGLVDEIGYLDDAVRRAAEAKGLTDYKVVVYDRPPTLLSLFSGQSSAQQSGPDLARLANATGPRVWYLAPQSEVAGFLATLNRP